MTILVKFPLLLGDFNPYLTEPSQETKHEHWMEIMECVPLFVVCLLGKPPVEGILPSQQNHHEVPKTYGGGSKPTAWYLFGEGSHHPRVVF